VGDGVFAYLFVSKKSFWFVHQNVVKFVVINDVWYNLSYSHFRTLTPTYRLPVSYHTLEALTRNHDLTAITSLGLVSLTVILE